MHLNHIPALRGAAGHKIGLARNPAGSSYRDFSISPRHPLWKNSKERMAIMQSERMSKRPVIVDTNGAQKLERVSLVAGTFKEDWIQGLLETEPSILPTAEIDPIFAPLVSVAREVRVSVDSDKSGRIDNLYISPQGYLVIVETKLWRNPEARREVVSQILDYAKEVREWNYEKLDSVYREYHKGKKSLFEAMNKDPSDEAAFIDTVEKNMKAARFLLMVVGDGIREGVERMAEFINQSPDMQHRLALCELEVYELGNGKRLVVPQLTTKTKVIERGVIRIENGNIKFDTMGEDSCGVPEESAKDKANSLTQEDFIAKYISHVKNVSGENLSDFFGDLESLGYRVWFGKATCAIWIDGKPCILELHTNGKNRFMAGRMKNSLVNRGYSESIGTKFIEQMRPFLANDPKNEGYPNNQGFALLDSVIITNKKDEFLAAAEEFKNNF
jgi:hypothetical protein